MIYSLQSYPSTVASFLTKTLEDEDFSRRTSCSVLRPNAGSDSSLIYFCFSLTYSLHVFSDTFNFYLEYKSRSNSASLSDQTSLKHPINSTHLRMSTNISSALDKTLQISSGI
jgi:hypothetical protein